MAVEGSPAARQSVAAALATLQRGDARGALAMLLEAEKSEPTDLHVKLHLALAQRALGDFPAALRALDSALAIDPYFFLALLSKGVVLERMGLTKFAAQVYRNALRIAPRPENTAASLEVPIRRAREVVAAEAEALAVYLREQVGELRARHAGEPLARFDECLEVCAGTRRVFNAEPVQMHVPRLPAIPFFDRDLFPWLPRLEAATEAIRAELVALLEAGMPGFAPYIAYAPGTPVNQWSELNHSRLWSSLWLWRDGERQVEAMDHCPRTTELLAGLPLADQPGFAPTALFSALAPRTRIPPHTGSTNARLVVHLPLVLPGPSRFRVGNDTRAWRMGEAWVFDDTIEHEAWNDADETRVILIFDIWNPLLSQAERELISAMMTARRDWIDRPAAGS
jgi:aspartyl/asparaginyl beta-hydroxylase (cupin superfamily)